MAKYGEVNSEEGYQNLRRFLFGRWAVNVSLAGLQPFAADWPVWQADMRLAIRGVSVVMSEQEAAHWCPTQIKEELKPKKPDDPPITLGEVRVDVHPPARMPREPAGLVHHLLPVRAEEHGPELHRASLVERPAIDRSQNLEPHPGDTGRGREICRSRSGVPGTEDIVHPTGGERRVPRAQQSLRGGRGFPVVEGLAACAVRRAAPTRAVPYGCTWRGHGVECG
jgi:hypothetical protein